MVLRGGSGNDLIYAGGYTTGASETDYGSIAYTETDADIYLYGDDGHDKIYGADTIAYQYLFGGEGDDLLQQGYMNFDPSTDEDVGRFYANGGAGDDIINLQVVDDSVSDGYDVEIILRGGKGNDKLNVYEGDLYLGGPVVDQPTYEANVGGGWNGNHILDGGEGDDEIWAIHNNDDEDGMYGGQRLYGGNGDDILKNASTVNNGMLLVG